MNLDRLRILIAPALASLLLVLALCTFVAQRPAGGGMLAPLPKVRTVAFKDCDSVSDRSIVVQLRRDDSTWINETWESHEQLGRTLTGIFESREEKDVYLLSDPDVSFAELANIYDTVASSTRDLYIVLNTRLLDNELRQCPPGSYCELDWQDRTYVPCASANIPIHIPRPALH